MTRIIEIAIFGLFAIVVLTRCSGRPANTVSPAKSFDNLNDVEKHVMQYDSVNGGYLQWTGTQDLGSGDPESVMRSLVLDKPNRFAIKTRFDDKTGFFTTVPGNINYSGQWIEENERITLKFYYPPVAWSELFDSLKNKNSVRPLDNVTVELDKNAKTIWIMGTACEKAE
jgi:hypothetical protein